MRWLGVAVSAALCVSAVRAEDWPGWLGPRRDGASTEIVAPWKGDLATAWTQPVGEGHSSPVVAGGLVFLHAKPKDQNVERIDAFDAKTGEPKWSRTYERGPFKSLFGNGPRGTPSVVGGKLYAFGITGVLSCLSADKGEIVWQVDTLQTYGAKNLFFGASTSPLVVGDRVFVNVGAKGASIVAFHKDTGKELWRSGDDSASYSSPIVLERDGQKQLVFLTGAALVGLDPETGKEQWRFPFRDGLAESSTTPVVAGGLLVGSSITLGSVGLKLGGAAPEKVWSSPDLTCYFSTPIPVGEGLYLVTGTKPPALRTSATLYCLDAGTGAVRWKRDNVGKYHATLLRTGDGKLLLLEEKGRLALLAPDAKEYRELASATVCGTTWAHPALANGRLFVRDDRELRAIDLPK